MSHVDLIWIMLTLGGWLRLRCHSYVCNMLTACVGIFWKGINVNITGETLLEIKKKITIHRYDM